MATGILGVVLSLIGVILAQQLIGRFEDGVGNSVGVTTDALAAVSDSVEVTRSMVTTIDDGLDSIGLTLTAISDALGEAGSTITDTQEFLGGSLPDALEAVGTILGDLEGVAGAVDDALRTLSRAPFGPDYDPAQPFDDTIRDLSAALEPLPDDLRGLSSDVDGLSASSATLVERVDALQVELTSLHQQVVLVEALLDRYAATTSQAQAVAADTEAELGAGTSQSRWLVVLLGLVFAAGQAVPIWLGSLLRADVSPRHVIVHHPHPDP